MEFRSYLICFDEVSVNDVAPDVGEHERAGDQEVKDCYLDFSYREGKTENIQTKVGKFVIDTKP